MSQSTSITEGGKGRPFGPVKALMVEGDDGKFYSWYPQSDKALGTLSVDKNGVYKASDKGVYGWGQVYVNVPQTDSVTGKDPDTGEEVVVRPDPETGEITETVVPVEIRVITPPTNPYGTYIDGQTITKDGMVVKAYSANGDEMQVVPIGEITINPTQAVYDESKDQPSGGEVDSDLITWTDQPISYSGHIHVVRSSTWEIDFYGAYFAVYHNNNNWTILAAAASPSSYTEESYNPQDPQGEKITSTHQIGGTGYTHDGKTAYYASLTFVASECSGATPVDGGGASRDYVIAWTILYGDGERHGAGSPQTITVSWPRPGDGAILETTFDILVGPRGGSGED